MSIQLKIKHIYGAGLVLTSCLFFKSTATAQPIPDETLPNNSEVNLENNTYQINGGTVAGDNLLHSFEQFSIPTGTEASFNNNSAIQNIISRVTGDSISNIDGAINANGNASLFFINPNGIIFGSNSSLNIGGSFIATTADSLQFADVREFSASEPQSLLTISTPVGLQFGESAGSITNQSGELISASNNTVALIGGDINLQGASIESFLGNIELGSVARNSQINLIPIDAGWTFDYDSVQNFGDIQLTQAQNIIEGESELSAILLGDDIQIQGKKVTITDGAQIFGNNTLEVNASDILTISGSIPSLLFEGVSINNGLFSSTFSDTDGGEIIINTGRLVVREGGVIASDAGANFDENTGKFIPASGNGGNITINATESIEITDGESGIFSSTVGFGSAGNITINTKDLSVSNGATISSESTGGTDSEQLIATGKGGEIEINASESIRLNSSTITSSTSGEGDDAGNLSLETNRLSVLKGSQISVSASGLGFAGDLEIAANSIILDRSSLNAETTVGDEGNISLNNADTLLLRDSRITTNATESATGGNIAINSDGIVLLDDSNITADAERGQGGNIQINTQGILRESNSQIRAESERGIDGTITFNTPDVDPVSGIQELPDVPIDAEAVLAQDFCKLENEKIAKGSSFIITGRGGLIPTSKDSLSNRDRLVDWASRNDIEVSNNGAVGIRQREQNLANEYPIIQQSQGLLVAKDGTTWLTANASLATAHSSQIAYPDCNSSERSLVK